MHLKSPLCHNKKEIDLWLACSPIPLAEPRRTHKLVRTQLNQFMEIVFICLLDPSSVFQSSRCTRTECTDTNWAPSLLTITSTMCAHVSACLCNSGSHFKAVHWHESRSLETSNYNCFVVSDFLIHSFVLVFCTCRFKASQKSHK